MRARTGAQWATGADMHDALLTVIPPSPPPETPQEASSGVPGGPDRAHGKPLAALAAKAMPLEAASLGQRHLLLALVLSAGTHKASTSVVEASRRNSCGKAL